MPPNRGNCKMLIDISMIVFVYCWSIVRRNFFKQKKDITSTNTIPNKFLLFLFLTQMVLHVFLMTMVYSLFIVSILLLIKITLLEQISNVSAGKYPYSTEKLIQEILSFLGNKNNMMFYIQLFLAYSLVLFFAISFVLPYEREQYILHSQIQHLFDGFLVFTMSWYIIWKFSSASTTIDILVGTGLMIFLIACLISAHILSKKQQ